LSRCGPGVADPAELADVAAALDAPDVRATRRSRRREAARRRGYNWLGGQVPTVDVIQQPDDVGNGAPHHVHVGLLDGLGAARSLADSTSVVEGSLMLVPPLCQGPVISARSHRRGLRLRGFPRFDVDVLRRFDTDFAARLVSLLHLGDELDDRGRRC
jgi:hypothetical protein